MLISAWILFRGDRPAPGVTVLVITGGLALWQVVLHTSVQSPMRIALSVRKPHVIQAILQLCIYLYWGLYWREPRSYAILIFVQITFAYQFDMLMSLSRKGVWYAGCGPLPIVLSINLFLWFKEYYFALHLLVIVVTYLAKDFLTWNQDGRTKHIFNPSAFSLAMASAFLLGTGSIDKYTTGVDLVESFHLPPNFFELIFLLGLVVQLLFATTALTLGSVITIYSLFYIAKWVLGGPIAPSSFDISIFLAMTLLATDPSTSPKSMMGKFLFGAVYGTAIFFAGIGVRYYQQPDYFNKILLIPLLNLMVPMFERVAGQIRRWGGRLGSIRYGNRICLVLYACLFIGIARSLKTPEPAPFAIPRLLPKPQVTSHELSDALLRKYYCRMMYPDVYGPFGFRNEIMLYPMLKQIYSGEFTPPDLYGTPP